jgi:asparagine synthase (glutamine-hydrolysing)
MQDWEPPTFDRLERETMSYDPINRVSALELQTYMLSTLLRDTDQMSMAHALEVRVPLLDHILVEYMFTLNGQYKIDKKNPKPLLTQPLNGLIPYECIHRPKQGFTFPFAIWLRESLYNELRASFIDQTSSCAAPFSPTGLSHLWQQFEHGQVGWSRVWAVFVLRKWLDEQRITIV